MWLLNASKTLGLGCPQKGVFKKGDDLKRGPYPSTDYEPYFGKKGCFQDERGKIQFEGY